MVSAARDAAAELSGSELALRCYELHEMADHARTSLVQDLRRIGDELEVYRFADRLKGQINILNKVLRKRDELRTANGAKATPAKYDADDVTDAWGCRFVTLFQSQILDVVRKLFQALDEWHAAGHKVLVDVIEIYTNRPNRDPTALAPRARAFIETFGTRHFVKGDRQYEIKHRVDSRDSGYSAVHFVLVVAAPRKVNRVDVADKVRFEIQIRDIFEEAWSQVSHMVSYGGKDQQYETGEAANVTVDIIARPQLNALKTVADGCSQLADQIRRTYDDLRGRLSIVDSSRAYTSVVPLHQVRDYVLAPIPPERDVLIETIRQAYDLLQNARDAADKNFDNRVSRDTYLAAAARFKDAIARAGEALRVALPDGKTIEWYLTIEQANSLIFSLPSKIKDAAEDQLAAYREACELYDRLATQYPNDHVVQLRRAQAQRKVVRTEPEARATIQRLVDCLGRLDSAGELLRGESRLTRRMVLVELGLARLDLSEMVRDNATRQQALSMAIQEMEQIIAATELAARPDPEELRIYHRALSNSLWCYHRMRAGAEDPLPKHDADRIAFYISELRSSVLWSVARFYAETIENLMFGSKLLDRIGDALDMARLNIKLLEEAANDQRRPNDNRDVTELLDPEQQGMFLRAIRFVQENGQIVAPDRVV